MTQYQHIVVAMDLSEESSLVLNRAVSLAQTNETQITLVHVIEPMVFAYGGDIPMDLSEVQEQLQQQASDRLSQLASPINIPQTSQHVVIGHPSSEIHRIAEDAQADLIIVGSHGRRGLALLLGSTANAVLHGAKCDVLAVRIKK